MARSSSMGTLKSLWRRATTTFANIFRSSDPLLRQRLLQHLRDFAFLYFAGGVIRRLAIAIQYNHVRNVSLVKFLYQILLRRRARTIEIDHNKLPPALVLFVKFDRTPRLPLGIEAAFAVENRVGRLAGDCSVFQMVPGDQRAILAVAGVVQMLIELEILGRMRGRSRRQRNSKQH